MGLFILYRVVQAGHSMMVDTVGNPYFPQDSRRTAHGLVLPLPNSIDTGESFLHKDWHLWLLIIRSFFLVIGMSRDQI
jgi:hypothetical protein